MADAAAIPAETTAMASADPAHPVAWSPFTSIFIVLCVICAILQYVQNKGIGAGTPTTPDFKKFQRVYLVVYLCAVLSDWLQGPYVYALYDYYKFSKHQIGILFIVGFGSSMFFGPHAGTMADRYGRKLSCLIYCILYTISCLTKHSPNFYILLIGRLTGGIATSILFSSFESWLVGEHNRHFYPAEWLNQTFALATIGNGVMAILAGQLGAVVRDYFGSLVAPFDLAIVFLIIAAAVIIIFWAENKGDNMALPSARPDSRSKWQIAMDTFKRDPKVFILGLIQSSFEGSMYIFVFMWTPKLEPHFPDLPHGQVFGCFMAAMMIGSSCVKYLTATRPPALYMRDVFAGASLCLAIPSVLVSSGNITFGCFCIFEAVCGVYWPSMGIMKSKYVPEEVRATMYNIFRIPLNFIVVVVLYNLGNISDDAVFSICSILLGAAAVMQHIFHGMVRKEERDAANGALGGGVSMEERDPLTSGEVKSDK